MKRQTLEAEKRTITGKRVIQLRRTGMLPANLYGKKIASQALQVKTIDFKTVYQEAGETTLVDLQIKGAKTVQPVLIHHPQKNPLTSEFLHTDFRVVALTEKMKIEVPVVLTGESEAETKHIGVLLLLHDKIEVEALPQDLPEEVTVDITSLKEVGNEIKIKDLKKDTKYQITQDGETTIVKINPLEKEVLPEPPAAPAEGEAVAEEGTTPEEKTASEGEKKPEAQEVKKEPEAPKQDKK